MLVRFIDVEHPKFTADVAGNALLGDDLNFSQSRPSPFDASLLVGAIIELAGYVAPDAAGDLTGKLQLFQKMMKYGLPTASMIALYELGFSDRVVAAEWSTSLGLDDEQHRDVRNKLKQESNPVATILRNYSSYFTHIMNDVIQADSLML